MSNIELAELIIGDKVLYKDKIYNVIYIYNSGYIEIKEKGNMFKVELVHYSEINKQIDISKLDIY